MTTIFGYQEVIKIVKNGVQEHGENPIDVQRNNYRESKKGLQGYVSIYQFVDTANFERIIGALSANEAWNILEKWYVGAEKLKRVRLKTLRRQYELLQMEN